MPILPLIKPISREGVSEIFLVATMARHRKKEAAGRKRVHLKNVSHHLLQCFSNPGVTQKSQAMGITIKRKESMI